MAQKFRLVKVFPPNPGEYMTAPGYFRAVKQEEKLTPANMGAVWNRDYTKDQFKAYIVSLPEPHSANYKAERENSLRLSHSLRL